MGRDERPDSRDDPPTSPSDEVRSYDGTGNNLEAPALGAAETAFRRLVDADYADGISEPSGEDRLSAREISNLISDQIESIPNDRGLTDLVWQWGQFIDHDIDLTLEGHDEEFNIAVPTGDEYFDPFATGTQEISLTRSAVADGTGVDSVREQINGITSFIDGSMVYGSSEETANSLRSFEGGRLLTSGDDLLPVDESGFFYAGDIRANEQNGLTAMHTLWVREHNRIADEIAARDSSLSDEEIFQEARAIVIGELQAITFNEYLPALLGRDAVPDYQGYDPTVDPSISNLFTTAIFRYGHTTLSSELLRLDDDGNVIDEGNLALRDAFFNPSEIVATGIDPLLKGLASNASQEIDTQLVDDVRNFLFGPPGAGGFDLAALNIQRGRDHGLPDYNSVREQLGLDPVESFDQITSDPELQAKLEEAYGDVNDIDVWVGALAEDHLPGGSVGELTQAVLLEQFTSLRDGDRFWYENVFDGQQLREIDSTRLSDVIERNTELTSIQTNAFFIAEAQPDRSDRQRGNDGQRDRRTDGQNGDRNGPQPGLQTPGDASQDGRPDRTDQPAPETLVSDTPLVSPAPNVAEQNGPQSQSAGADEQVRRDRSDGDPVDQFFGQLGREGDRR